MNWLPSSDEEQEAYSQCKSRPANAQPKPLKESKWPHMGHDGYPPRPSSPTAKRYRLRPFPYKKTGGHDA